MGAKLDNTGIPIVTYAYLAVCTFFFFYGYCWIFNVSHIFIQPLTLVGCSFSHPTFGHLFGNMLFLGLFGPACEERLGHTKLAFILLVSGILSAVGFSVLFGGSSIVGASGAICALIAIYPFVQKNWLQTVGSAVICAVYFYLNLVGMISDIQMPLLASTAHLAHLIGGVTGLIMFKYFSKN